MGNIYDAFPSKYLKASDLQGRQPIVTIDRVEYEEVGKQRDRKPILYFANKDKGMVLNKTNANKVIAITGSAVTEEWQGAAVQLFVAQVEFQGDMVDAIRIKQPVRGQKPAPAPPKPAPAPKPVMPADKEEIFDSGPMDDSDIPF